MFVAGGVAVAFAVVVQ
ncbi:unnamed protein product, partial [Rotaria magnacalcarata]